MKLLFEHPLLTVWFHVGRNVVHHRVARPILSDELAVVRAAFGSGTDAMRKYGATKWLSDDRAQLVMPSEVQEWCQKVWFPATRSAGWKHWAIIQPESAVARLFIGRTAAAVSAAGLSVQMFTDVPEALGWLDKVGP
jgi:hypothetical protein